MSENITIICATCGLTAHTPRCDTDPPDAVQLRGIVCPDCDTGGFDMPEYFDANGTSISIEFEEAKDVQ